MKKTHKKLKRIISASLFSGRTIAAVLIVLLFIKQRVVYAIYGQQIDTSFINTILIYLGFFANDLMVFGIILIFVFINLNIKNKIIKIIINCLSFFLLLLFFIDIITIYFFQSRLSIFELYGFFTTSNGTSFFNYIALVTGIFISLCITTFFITQKYFKKLKERQIQRMIAVWFFCIMLCISSVNFFTRDNRDLVENILSLNIQTLQQHMKGNSGFITNNGLNGRKYSDYFTTIQGKNKKENVILVFAESFSTVDSKRAGGLYNNFPLFDKIQSEGVTFTNFLANGCTSETAHIALLEGIEPWENPLMNSDQAYDTYATYEPTLPVFFNGLGYQTTFLSSVTLDFLNEKKFLSGLQFKTIIGEEAFKNEKKYVFDAAPDHVLYNKALNLVQTYQTGSNPYFLAMQTISSHRPYDTPYGSNTDEMFKYVDRSLYAFYQKLKKIGFFNNGLLIIVGDHRKMEAIDKDEFKKFGMSTHSRALATIIGKDIKPNTINNNITQHTDIFNSLKYMFGSGKVVVSNLFNNVFTNKTERDWGIRYCRFAEKTYAVIKKSGESYRLTQNRDFPIRGYIDAYKRFEAEQLLGLTNFTGYHAPALNTGTALSEYTVIAHAGGGYGGWLPNAYNTFQRAKDDGADAIEFDVTYTKDDQNVIMHGPSLQTTICGPNKNIYDFNLNEVQKTCKLKNGETILTLEDFLTKVKGQFKYYFLEIKVNDQTKAEKQTLAAINTVIKLGMEDKVIFISYDRIANYIIGSHKKIRAGRDSYYTGEVALIHEFPHEFYLIDKDSIDKDSATIAKAMNKKFVVYTVNTPSDFEKVNTFGAKMIMTDNPPLLKTLIKRTVSKSQ